MQKALRILLIFLLLLPAAHLAAAVLAVLTRLHLLVGFLIDDNDTVLGLLTQIGAQAERPIDHGVRTQSLADKSTLWVR